MGLLKAWKGLKAVAASGLPTDTGSRPPGTPRQQQAPRGPAGMMAGFGGVMLKMMSPLLICEAPERGDPLPATEPGVLGPQDPAALDAGIAAIRARDAAFDPQALSTFSDQVFGAVSAAWGANDAASVRSVLADSLWNPMAAAITGGAAGGMGMIFAMMQPRSTLAGVWAGPCYDTARFTIAVHVDVPPDAGPMPAGMTPDWNEDWLYQRSITPGGAPMQLVESCPSCGAPTATDDTGLCSHCRQPIPILTAGWLLTCVRSHNPLVIMMLDKMVDQLRANPSEMAMIPDELVRVLPFDVVHELAPERAAALHLRPR